MLFWQDTLLILVAALAFDALIGDPDWLWRRLPHPVTWIGWVIGRADRYLNRPGRDAEWRRSAGIALLASLVVLSLILGAMLESWLRRLSLRTGLPLGEILLALIASVLIAQNSLGAHVGRVRDAFAQGGIAEARRAVAMIVGRDPESLDEAGISRAAIESAAENFSDGVVAPAFWFALLGLPGLIAYKAVNTADSMIGHLSDKHRDFGWASARFDDLVNWAPARYAGALVALAAPLAGRSPLTAWRVMQRDAGRHRSPNAGWPEAAMAGALGLALAGPRLYASGRVDDPFLNPEGRRDARSADIGRALRVMTGAALLHGLAYLLLALVLG